MGIFILKIRVNYDLMKKVTLSKKGYSLKLKNAYYLMMNLKTAKYIHITPEE